jgi:hypothetical protein
VRAFVSRKAGPAANVLSDRASVRARRMVSRLDCCVCVGMYKHSKQQAGVSHRQGTSRLSREQG